VFGRVREKIGPAIGMSGATYERAKVVVKAAKDDPETFGEIAAEMDRTGRVKSAYNKVREKQGAPCHDSHTVVGLLLGQR